MSEEKRLELLEYITSNINAKNFDSLHHVRNIDQQQLKSSFGYGNYNEFDRLQKAAINNLPDKDIEFYYTLMKKYVENISILPSDMDESVSLKGFIFIIPEYCCEDYSECNDFNIMMYYTYDI
jgi:hypothetical protein